MLKWLPLWLSFFLSLGSFAQDRVVLSASSTEVGLGERFEIVLSAPVKGQGEIDLKDAFTKLTEMHGSGFSNINGHVTSEYKLTLLVVAKRLGTFTIPPATWVSGTKKYKSNSLKIKVVKATVPPQAPSPPLDPFEEFFSRPQTIEPVQPEAFAQLITTKKTVFAGEPIVLKGKAYIEGRISDIADYAAYKIDFLHHITNLINPNEGVQPIAEEMNNKTYSVLRLFEDVVVPQEEGSFNIPAFAISMGYPSGFFGSNYLRVKSNELSIQVKPLPSNAPESFQGALGQLKMLVSHTARENMKTGDVFTIRVQISGKGNLHLIKPIVLNLPDGLQSYGDVEIDDQVLINANGVSGSLIYTYKVQIQKPKQYSFKPLNFSYFDTDTEDYKEVEIPSISFEADGEDLTQTTNLGNSQSGKTKDGSNWWIWLLIGLASATSLFFLFRFVQRNSLKVKKSPKPKATDAKSNALKSLRQLDDISSDLLSQMELVAIQFFKELTQDPHFLVSEEAIREFADKQGISNEVSDAWREFWREIQSMKYANFGQISTADLKHRLKELIEKT